MNVKRYLLIKGNQISQVKKFRAFPSMGFPGGLAVKNLPANQETRFNPWVGKVPWGRKWQPTIVILLGNLTDRGAFGGLQSMWLQSDTTEWLNSMHGKVQESGITEIIPLMCTSAIWGQYLLWRDLTLETYKLPKHASSVEWVIELYLRSSTLGQEGPRLVNTRNAWEESQEGTTLGPTVTDASICTNPKPW